jgi:hypothetical protein
VGAFQLNMSIPPFFRQVYFNLKERLIFPPYLRHLYFNFGQLLE